jgi:hypothetical protein
MGVRKTPGRTVRDWARKALRAGLIRPQAFAELLELADSIDGGLDRLYVLDAAAIQLTTRRGPASGRRPPQGPGLHRRPRPAPGGEGAPAARPCPEDESAGAAKAGGDEA